MHVVYIVWMNSTWFVQLDNVQKNRRSQSLSWMLGREKIIIVCSVKRNAVRDFNSRFHGNNPRIFTNERKPTLQWAPSKIKESFLVNCNHIFIFSFFFFSIFTRPEECQSRQKQNRMRE